MSQIVVHETSAVSDLVAAALTGVTVVVGVLLAELMARLRDRRASLEEDVRRLEMAVPYVVTGLAELSSPMDTSLGSVWQRNHEDVMNAVARIERAARWPIRRAKKIRAEARRLLSQVGGAYLAASIDGRRLAPHELSHFRTMELAELVNGRRPSSADLTDHYRRNGPAARPPTG